MKVEFFRQMFEKYSDIMFNENTPSGSQVGPCWRTEGRTDMKKLIVSFRSFANASKMTQSEIII
jgi:hypothetical protein